MTDERRVYEIPVPPGVAGRLGVMPAPPGRRRLAGHLRGVRAAGVDVLVCLLPGWEAALLGLSREPDLARAAGMAFDRLPVRDHHVPRREAADPVVERLAREVRAGRFVVVHCRGGIGRSSVVAGAILVDLGATPAEAFTAIGAARGRRVPETPAQRRWLDRPR
jgi:protein-tyrosine phosphatase